MQAVELWLLDKQIHLHSSLALLPPCSSQHTNCLRSLHFQGTNTIIKMDRASKHKKWDKFTIPSEVSSKNVTFVCGYDTNYGWLGARNPAKRMHCCTSSPTANGDPHIHFRRGWNYRPACYRTSLQAPSTSLYPGFFGCQRLGSEEARYPFTERAPVSVGPYHERLENLYPLHKIPTDEAELLESQS